MRRAAYSRSFSSAYVANRVSLSSPSSSSGTMSTAGRTRTPGGLGRPLSCTLSSHVCPIRFVVVQLHDRCSPSSPVARLSKTLPTPQVS